MPWGMMVKPTVIPAIASDTAQSRLYLGSHSRMGSFFLNAFLALLLVTPWFAAHTASGGEVVRCLHVAVHIGLGMNLTSHKELTAKIAY